MTIKKISYFLILLTVGIAFSCGGPKQSAPEAGASADTSSVADTGYTGIKQYFTGNTLIKEVTFKNGVRNGVMKSFYNGKQIRQTFWYKDMHDLIFMKLNRRDHAHFTHSWLPSISAL